MTTAAILARLVEARKNAGLSLSQAGCLSELGSSGVMLIEEGFAPLTPETLVALCALYDCSPEWALTGVNPYFDPAPLAAKLADASGRLSADAEDVIDLLASLRHEPDNGGEEDS